MLKVVAAALTAVPLIGGLAGALGGPAVVTGQRRGLDASTPTQLPTDLDDAIHTLAANATG